MHENSGLGVRKLRNTHWASDLALAFLLAPVQEAADSADVGVHRRLLQASTVPAAVLKEVDGEGVHAPAVELVQLGVAVRLAPGKEDAAERVAVAALDGGAGEATGSAGHEVVIDKAGERRGDGW